MADNKNIGKDNDAGAVAGGMDMRGLFLRHVAQTSPNPLAIEIAKAEGLYLYDPAGKAYMDLIGGISVCNTGHRHPRVVEAIREQTDRYLHVLVYGELIQSPQVQYARLLAEHLPASLNSVYFTNSGAEATEGAMKLAKRLTGRTEVVAFDQSYHGSTQGALSVMGDEYWRNAYRPLLPGVWHMKYDAMESLERITGDTACVIAETVQAERGVYAPRMEWMQALRRRCDETGALLILDEIQAGFGRTGRLWGFEQYGIVPDIVLFGKALGGGMPLGAFVADREKMWALTGAPVLGHITTFGGHPVSCAAGRAGLQVLLEEGWIREVGKKEALFRELLVHPAIKAVRSCGLLMAVEFESYTINKGIIDRCIEKGLLTDWFLFAPHCMRVAPPLLITEEEIRKACAIILSCIQQG
ncbi:MAG TPA: aspartate aminotransferase family protein [Puia sp.]|nr:aspartate aminotransferase family protein [Puia sp.]